MPSITLSIQDLSSWHLTQSITLIVSSAIQPAVNSHESIISAARDLNILFPGQYTDDDETKGTEEGFLHSLWDCFHNFARQIPYDSMEAERLVDIVKALKTEIPSRHIELDGWDGAELWAGLPLLGPTITDSFGREDGEPFDYPRDPTKQQRQLNYNGFCARLSGQGLVSHMEWLGIKCMASALEGVIKPVRGSKDLVDSDPNAVPELPFQIARAAIWIKHTGHTWYGRDEECGGGGGEPLYRLETKEGKLLKDKYKGAALCLQRWQLWKERFGTVSCGEGVDEVTKKIAGEAVQIMEKIESGHGAVLSG